MPSITAEEAQKVRPWISLAEKLGAFAGQVTEHQHRRRGDPLRRHGGRTQHARADAGRAAGPAQADAGRSQHGQCARSSPRSAASRSARRAAPRQGVYEGYIKVTVTLADGTTRRVAGTVFSDGRPRLIQVKGINMDAEFAPHMLYVINEDKPGFIGKLGTCWAKRASTSPTSIWAALTPGADAIAPGRGRRAGGRKGAGRDPQAAAGETGQRAGVLTPSQTDRTGPRSRRNGGPFLSTRPCKTAPNWGAEAYDAYRRRVPMLVPFGPK